MKIKKLIKDLQVKMLKGSKEVEIEAVTSNSKWASPGCLFIAKRGEKFDGNDFIQDALLAGAVAVVTDIYNPFIENVVQIIVENVQEAETIIGKTFFQDPASELFLVGITGTNGKTTTSYLTRHLFQGQESMGLIGTIERIVGEFSYASDLTMPDAITCLKLLHDMRQFGQTSAVMEVCSHGLDQNRADALSFDIAAFTNLSPEHLDYHQTMEKYFAAKCKLFSKLKPGGVAVVNIDDPYGKQIQRDHLITFGIDQEADYRAIDIQFDEEGTSFILQMGEEQTLIKTPLLGKFNVYNALCAIAIARVRKIPLSMIVERMKSSPQVNGRLEKVSLSDGKRVYIDFAHTDDALRQALMTLKQITKGRLIVVFGCGGERDYEKRPRMAEVCESIADYSIVTSDNPRGEDPIEIAEQVCKGFKSDRYQILLDRREAIKHGLNQLQEGDVLLIAGKGHEKKQVYLGKSVDFDDISIAKELSNC